MQTAQSSPTLFDAFSAEGSSARPAYVAGAMLLGVCLLTLSAKIQVPFWPVPMTMQTLVVFMIGMAYGGRLGAATVLAYLLAGAAGLPVFAGTPERGIGLAYMMGPTGGFLFGFLMAAWITGVLAERGWDRSVFWCAMAMLIGTVALYVVGLAVLMPYVGLWRAIEVGLLPFVASSTLKIGLGAMAMPLIWRFVRQSPGG